MEDQRRLPPDLGIVMGQTEILEGPADVRFGPTADISVTIDMSASNSAADATE
jgi:hypothetical protein